MGDVLEKFIIDNRSDFDDLEPTDKHWQSIQSRLHKGRRDWSFLWKVAAVVFLASTVYLVIDKNYKAQQDNEVVAMQNEFNDAERYYFQMISQHKAALNQLGIAKRNYDLIEEEEKLDKLYQKLKSDYHNKNQSEVVRDAMLQNLRMRVQILSEQIRILSQTQNEIENEDIEI